MFNIKIPVLGFLWKQEIFQILVNYCFYCYILLSQNNLLILLHLSSAKAASYLEVHPA